MEESLSSVSSIGISDILDFSSNDTYDEERQERVCIKNYCEETIQKYSDFEFTRNFRLNRDIVNDLIKQYSESEFCKCIENCQ